MISETDREALIAKLKQLSELAWDDECEWPVVEKWLRQFDGKSELSEDEERCEMLYLLTNFIFFGMREVRGLLKSLYRDIVQYRLIESIRRENGYTADISLIKEKLRRELDCTRFIPIGNPSESSNHLLYYFRQENGLPKKVFSNAIEILDYTQDTIRLRDPEILRYVLIDDFAGSGSQAIKFARDVIQPIKAAAPEANFSYYMLIATTSAMERLRGLAFCSADARLFEDVACVFELGDEFKAFSETSLFYPNQQNKRESARKVADVYGYQLRPKSPLGYKNGELILGFAHNVPNNTLPIFSWEGQQNRSWMSPFTRYPKH